MEAATGERKKVSLSIRAANGVRAKVELHWYEGHGVGKKELKVKQVIEIYHEQTD